MVCARSILCLTPASNPLKEPARTDTTFSPTQVTMGYPETIHKRQIITKLTFQHNSWSILQRFLSLTLPVVIRILLDEDPPLFLVAKIFITRIDRH